MAIHPIEYRYGTAEMKYVWSQENRLAKILQTEAALARAEADMGLIPAEAAEIIFESIASVKAERVDEIESEIHHDMMAVVVAISEMCRDDAGKWVHFRPLQTIFLIPQQLSRLKTQLIFWKTNSKPF